MAKLTTKARKALPTSEFAGPDRSYPISDENHARNALAMAAQHADPAERARIRAAVHRKYPHIAQEGQSMIGGDKPKKSAAQKMYGG